MYISFRNKMQVDICSFRVNCEICTRKYEYYISPIVAQDGFTMHLCL